MNINLMVQGLAADIIQDVQTTLPGEPGGEGSEFEDMLVKQSQAAKAKDEPKTDAAGEEPAGTKQEEKTEKDSAKEEETTQQGSEVAAALVTSQPVVLFGASAPAVGDVQAEFVTVEVQEVEPAAQLLTENAAPVVEDDALPPVAEEPKAQAVETAPQQMEQAADLTESPVQETVPAAEEAPQADVQTADTQQNDQPQAVHHVQVQAQAEAKPDDEVETVEVWQEAEPVFRQDTAVPVKVADPEPVYAEEPQAPRQLAGQIGQTLAQGESMVQLQLSPANLGKLTVEITRSAEGVMSIVLTPETAKAASLLQQHSGSLLSAMLGEGHAVAEVIVQQPQQPENANQFLNPDGQNRQQQHHHQQQQHRQKGTTEDFLQQLRLGLVDANITTD